MITPEKIKEMNIPVVTPIEITTNYKFYENEKIKGYFQGLLKEPHELRVVYSYKKLKSKINVKNDLAIHYIRKIKISN